MAFHEERFPTDLSFGAVGGPERRTEIVTLANGFEERNTPWAHSRRRYDAGFGLRSLEDVELLVAFFEARRGQLHGFRWKDWADFSSAPGGAVPDFDDQRIGTGDGTTRAFGLRKTYGVGESAYARPISKPVAGSVRVGVDGVEVSAFEVDHSTGEIVLDAAPANGVVVTAGFLFDVPVRFDADRIDVSLATFNAGQVPDVPVVELRV
ncbi:TIGR02217 family protein [Palleronia marisminoris]|uniref:DUF2460 domain-containing protein n=1 Tax=Palleronia marisminoris TaxID=315423 RepID=A0A1Y5RGN5_9RHOB|nr:DUF2460 domain-containing protein [Palleronia marisminoris]SFG18572.1 TIGR02217 family protein [Palleronia marisminoris]SLN16962.1 hypothetical protein PAM7066_00438 [Palleronia marisminoris]